MKNILIMLLFLLYLGVLTIQGQTPLEKAVKRINVNMELPSCFNVSQNENFVDVTEVTVKDSLSKPANENAVINTIFGGIDAILEHKDGEYLVFVYVSPGRSGGKYGAIITDSTELFVLKNLSFGRIKRDFRYGKPNLDASELEADELYSMLTIYPKEQTREMFNANVMVMYPLNLRGNIYKDKYTRSRAVVIAKDRLDICFYFMMTDKSVKNFDTYLKDLGKAFWFND